MVDFSSATWHGIRQFAEERLAVAREKNDDQTLNDIDTAALRGEIKVWKDLLGLPDEMKARLSVLPGDDAA